MTIFMTFTNENDIIAAEFVQTFSFDDSTINDAFDPSENSNRHHQIEILNLNSHFDPI